MVSCFLLQEQSRAGITETTWPAGAKIFTICPLQKKSTKSALEQKITQPSPDRDLEACHGHKRGKKTGLKRQKGITDAQIKKIKLREHMGRKN